jgi:hypothetical protein
VTIFESGRDTFRQASNRRKKQCRRGMAGWRVGISCDPLGTLELTEGISSENRSSNNCAHFWSEATLLSVLERQQESESCFFQWPVDIKS